MMTDVKKAGADVSDVFDLSKTSPDRRPDDADASVSAAQAAKSSRRMPGSPLMYFWGIVAIVGCIWTFVPFGASNTQVASDGRDRLLAPAEAMAEAATTGSSRDAPASAVEGDKASELAAAAVEAAPPGAGPASGASDPAAPQVEANLEVANQKLLARIAALEQQVVAGAPLCPPSEIKSASRPRKRMVHRPIPAPAAHSDHAIGYRLNTVYRNEAWIQKGDRTFVVQEGDELDGVEIKRVDPLGRRVLTSAGDIR